MFVCSQIWLNYLYGWSPLFFKKPWRGGHSQDLGAGGTDLPPRHVSYIENVHVATAVAQQGGDNRLATFCGEAFQTRTVATRRLVDRRSAGANGDVCCERFESSGTSFFFLSICRRFKFEAQIWAPIWCQFAQFFFVEYSYLQGRVLQARFASALIRISSSFTSQSLLTDWLIDCFFFFLSFFSSCSLGFSIGFLWVFTLVLR